MELAISLIFEFNRPIYFQNPGTNKLEQSSRLFFEIIPNLAISRLEETSFISTSVVL